ncbi:hypothetical protein QYM36_011507 [Artemia franciscana]|uniref:Uncharacterized protein n=1 Tax=Artemia franciscana TaxID=6661 RepID=A0AA88L961_ARTSF|nr:hypothetical protein QYM36_011507 [Artemia franciscana]
MLHVRVEYFELSSMYFIIADTSADILSSVKTQIMECTSISSDVDTAKISPAFNQLIPDNQQQADQRKLNLRRRKDNVVYYGCFDSDVKDFSNEETTADLLTTVKTENIDIFSESMALDTVKNSPVSNQLMMDSQNQEDQGKTDLRRSKPYRINDISNEGFTSLSKTSEKKAKKDYLSIVQSTPDVQEKPNLRQRKKNTIYVESSDSDRDDSTDEGRERRNPPAESWPDYLEEMEKQGHSGLDENVDLRNIVGLESERSNRPFTEEDQELFFTQDEVLKSLKIMRSRSLPGTDGISAKIWKRTRVGALPMIVIFFQS